MDINFRSVVKELVDELYKEGMLDEPFEAVESLIDNIILKSAAPGVSGFDAGKVAPGLPTNAPLAPPKAPVLKSMTGSSLNASRVPKKLKSPAAPKAQPSAPAPKLPGSSGVGSIVK